MNHTNNRPQINIGDTLICSVTGKQFVAEMEGCSFNYALGHDGRIYSNEGVDIAERQELKDRAKPFFCYLSGDGKTITGWKGNVLGRVVWSSVAHNGFHGSPITHVNVIDVHGGKWHGKGSGNGMYITLHPSKRA
jgi:hypothetical protein